MWSSKIKSVDNEMIVEDVAQDNDQQEQWNLRMEQAAEGLISARAWRDDVQQYLEELTCASVLRQYVVTV